MSNGSLATDQSSTGNFKINNRKFFFYIPHNMAPLQLIHQPTNTLNKVLFIKSVAMLHVSEPGCIIREFQNKRSNPQHINLGIALSVLKCLQY